jgi:hypothetical protein
MTGPQAAAPPSAQKMAARRAGLRQASLVVLIMLIVQFALGIGVNLYVTLPPAGTPGRGSDQSFSNGPLLAAHAVVGLLLVITAIYLLIRAIIARHVTLIVTSVAGLAAIITAAIYGAGFASKVTDADSMRMAMATAAALASYAIGLFAAAQRDVMTARERRRRAAGPARQHPPGAVAGGGETGSERRCGHRGRWAPLSSQRPRGSTKSGQAQEGDRHVHGQS